jgi:hypothetical protein
VKTLAYREPDGTISRSGSFTYRGHKVRVFRGGWPGATWSYEIDGQFRFSSFKSLAKLIPIIKTKIREAEKS